jgi:hypothetical protein
VNIIGGEFLDDPKHGGDNNSDQTWTDPLTGAEVPGPGNIEQGSGADRLTVPPFVWTSNGPGPDDLDPSAAGHNPYVKVSLVQKLVALGTQ